MTYYIFQELSPNVVSHTAASRALAENPAFGQFTGFISGEMWPSAARLVDAMEKWPGSEEPNESGFSLAYATDIPMTDAIGRDPRRASQMAGAMNFMQSGPAYAPRHFLENFEWGDAAQGLLVDVGGAQGEVAIEIARYLPGIKCVVQDLPEVIKDAKVPDDLKADGRLRFLAHDFFKEQPVKGADIYYLRWILHDWSDKYAANILRNLVPALGKGARVLISDLCIPPPCVLSPYRARRGR